MQLSPRAVRDLKTLQRSDVRRVAAALKELELRDELPAGVRAPVGAHPYLRVRVDDWRIIFCPAWHVDPDATQPGWYVARIANRRDLDTTVRKL